MTSKKPSEGSTSSRASILRASILDRLAKNDTLIREVAGYRWISKPSRRIEAAVVDELIRDGFVEPKASQMRGVDRIILTDGGRQKQKGISR